MHMASASLMAALTASGLGQDSRLEAVHLNGPAICSDNQST